MITIKKINNIQEIKTNPGRYIRFSAHDWLDLTGPKPIQCSIPHCRILERQMQAYSRGQANRG